MPGLLGAEKDFAKQYRAPLAPKHHISAFERKEVVFKDETVALQLLSQLHKIALPFILRRMKSEVCAELPPKIMTDYPVKISAM
jgi:TATA-binding protein-associated factor